MQFMCETGAYCSPPFSPLGADLRIRLDPAQTQAQPKTYNTSTSTSPKKRESQTLLFLGFFSSLQPYRLNHDRPLAKPPRCARVWGLSRTSLSLTGDKRREPLPTIITPSAVFLGPPRPPSLWKTKDTHQSKPLLRPPKHSPRAVHRWLKGIVWRDVEERRATKGAAGTSRVGEKGR